MTPLPTPVIPRIAEAAAIPLRVDRGGWHKVKRTQQLNTARAYLPNIGCHRSEIDPQYRERACLVT
jgi:hypothetical protein